MTGEISADSMFAEDGMDLYMRQAPEPFRQNGQVMHRAFIPRRDDNGRLSGNLRSVTSAQVASEYRAAARERAPQHVWGLSLEEVENAGLNVVDDSSEIPDLPVPPGHASLDYSALLGEENSSHLVEDTAADFAILANNRGRLYPAPDLGSAQGTMIH